MLFLIILVAASDFYVSNKWGSDLNNCTADSMCKTLEKAYSLSKPYDQIWIGGGEDYPCTGLNVNHPLNILGYDKAQFVCEKMGQPILSFNKGGELYYLLISAGTISFKENLIGNDLIFTNLTNKSSIYSLNKESSLTLENSAFIDVSSPLSGRFKNINLKGVAMLVGSDCLTEKIMVEELTIQKNLWSGFCPLQLRIGNLLSIKKTKITGSQIEVESDNLQIIFYNVSQSQNIFKIKAKSCSFSFEYLKTESTTYSFDCGNTNIEKGIL